MKKNLLTLILLITTVCWSNSVFAQPANNECSGAQFIAAAPGFPLQFGPFDNTTATSEMSDPADPGFPDTDSGLTNTLWYQFVGDGGTYFIYTSTECSGFEISGDDYIDFGDTQMAIYTGECGSLELIAANEDNFMVPGYDIADNYPAGVELATEVGVTYTIMIDGFGGSVGQYCITTTDALPAPCDANVDLLPGLPTEVVLCPTDEVAFTVDPATLSFGPADYVPDGRASTVVWIMTSADPMGLDPLLDPATADIFVGIFSNDVTLTDHTLPGTSDGLSPIGGAAASLSEIWFTAYILNYSTSTGGLFFANCDAYATTAIHVTWLADGEGDCVDNCSDANVDLADGTDLMYSLCLDDVLPDIGFNEATINYGGLVGDNPTPVWIFNTEDPMGDPLGTPGGLFLPPLSPEDAPLAGDGIADTIWFTASLIEDIDPDTGSILVWECQPLTETIMVIFLAEDDPACAVVECGIEEGDAGEISTMDETTICVGDGEPDVLSFTSTYAGMGNYGYIITDDAGEILSPGVVGTTEFSTDFDDAGVGECLVWGFTWEGDLADAIVQGANAIEILIGLPEDACYDITAPLSVFREDCTPEPLETSDATTSDDGSTYTVTFDITGGSGNYSADGGTIMGSTFTSDPIECGTAYSFTVTDDEGQSTTVAGDAPCEAVVDVCPIVVDVQETCTGETSGTVTLTIMGGTAPYFIGGTITDQVDGDTYTFQIEDNEEYNLEVSGSGDCEAVVGIVGILVCSKCGNEGGSVVETSGGSSTACGDASVSVMAAGSVVTDGSVIVYILHSDANDPMGSMLASNSTGTFSRADAGGAGTYYVTAVVGVDGDFDGAIDFFGDECTVYSANALEVNFVEGSELTIAVSEDCDEEVGLVTVNVTVSGGVAPYTISGNLFSGTDDDGTFSFTAADGDTYTIDATDSSGCASVSFTSEQVVCEKDQAVEWLSFEGEVQTAGNFLVWMTASETNNEYFAVERSLDGKNFETIATVKAVGESFTPTAYDYLDRSAPNGTSYYRVTQFDFDGQNESTNVISLTRGEGSFDITNVRPVPAVDYIEVSYTAINNGTVEVSIHDLTGRLMMKTNVDATSGANTQVIDISTYPSGIYMVSLNNGTDVATQRLVKE